MKENTLISILCVATVGLLLAGLGLLLANMFFEPKTNLLPYALGCIALGNLLNTVRTVRQKKK